MATDPDRPWDAPKADAPEGDASEGFRMKPLYWLIVVVVLVGGIGALNSSDGKREPDEYGARTACEDRVETLLKSPSTAGFNDVSAVPFGKDSWTVTGSVDAENSFGASIRASFTCKATSTNGEYWTTSEVDLR